MKTVGGSLAFFVAALLVTAGVFGYLRDFPDVGSFVATALLVGILAALAEALSTNGWDNVTIPVAVLLGMMAVAWLTNLETSLI